MEQIVQILTENCAGVEARANIRIKQIGIIKPITLIMTFAASSNRSVRLFGLPECETTVFELLKTPENLSGIRIRDNIFWIHQHTSYFVSPHEDGLCVEIQRPKIEKEKTRK